MILRNQRAAPPSLLIECTCSSCGTVLPSHAMPCRVRVGMGRLVHRTAPWWFFGVFTCIAPIYRSLKRREELDAPSVYQELNATKQRSNNLYSCAALTQFPCRLLLLQLPPEWTDQFASGIQARAGALVLSAEFSLVFLINTICCCVQTIAVIQAGHGLLQLGSCKIVSAN